MSKQVIVEYPVTIEQAELAAEGMLGTLSFPEAHGLVSPPPQRKSAEQGGLVFADETKSERLQSKKSIAEGKLCQIYNGGGKMVLQFATTILFFKPALATGIKALMAAIEAVCEKEEE